MFFFSKQKSKTSLFFVNSFLFVALFFQSCGSDSTSRNARDSASAFVNNSENTAVFGHFNVHTILNKAEYRKNPMLDMMLGSLDDAWSKAIDLDKPIYVAGNAPFDKTGMPKDIYFFMDLKNEKALDSILNEGGYTIEKEGDLKFFSDDKAVFGVKGKLIFGCITTDLADPKVLLTKTLETCNKELSTGKQLDILDGKGDLVLGTSIERLLLTSNTELNKANKAKMDELKEESKDSYVQTTVNFNPGEILIENDHLFTDKLKKRLFFKDNAMNTHIKQLKGNAFAGVSVNIDMMQFENFANDFFPQVVKAIIDQMPQEAKFGLMALGDKPLTKLFTGDFVAVSNGTPTKGFKLTDNYNGFLGLTQKGSFLGELMKSFSEKKRVNQPQLPMMFPEKDGILMTSTNFAESVAFKNPNFAPLFGKNSMTMFFDFKALDPDKMEMNKSMRVLTLFDFMTGNVTEEKGVIRVKMKNTKQNVLAQLRSYFEEEIGNIQPS